MGLDDINEEQQRDEKISEHTQITIKIARDIEHLLKIIDHDRGNGIRAKEIQTLISMLQAKLNAAVARKHDISPRDEKWLPPLPIPVEEKKSKKRKKTRELSCRDKTENFLNITSKNLTFEDKFKIAYPNISLPSSELEQVVKVAERAYQKIPAYSPDFTINIDQIKKIEQIKAVQVAEARKRGIKVRPFIVAYPPIKTTIIEYLSELYIGSSNNDPDTYINANHWLITQLDQTYPHLIKKRYTESHEKDRDINIARLFFSDPLCSLEKRFLLYMIKVGKKKVSYIPTLQKIGGKAELYYFLEPETRSALDLKEMSEIGADLMPLSHFLFLYHQALFYNDTRLITELLGKRPQGRYYGTLGDKGIYCIYPIISQKNGIHIVKPEIDCKPLEGGITGKHFNYVL